MTPFRKMQGLGNDFVVLDAREKPVPMTASRARAIADRHFGVGCDTLVLITAETMNDVAATMRLYERGAPGAPWQALGDAEPDLLRVLGPIPELTRSWRLLVHPDLRRIPRIAAFFDFVAEEREALKSILTG